MLCEALSTRLDVEADLALSPVILESLKCLERPEMVVPGVRTLS